MRFAVIGLGNATAMFHRPALARIEGAQLAGGFDLAEERRTVWVRETGSPAYATLDELLERERPEVVVVATPPGSHAEVCLQALAAGCHVFCEKPLAESTADVDRIVAAAAAAGRKVSVNLEFREHPIFRAVREEVASGRHGRLAFCQLWQLMNLPPWAEPTPWRAQMANRALLEGGIHLVDLLLAIYGDAPVAVSARLSAGFHDDQEADAIQLVTVEFPGGRLGQLTIDRLCPAGMRYLEVRADCEDASLRASFGGRATLRLGLKRAEKPGAQLELGRAGLAWVERGASRSTLARNPNDAGVVGTTRLLDGLIRAIERDEEPPSSAREARTVLAVIEAAYQSARTGERTAVSAPA